SPLYIRTTTIRFYFTGSNVVVVSETPLVPAAGLVATALALTADPAAVALALGVPSLFAKDL
ncbi:hypothetical protein, partial [Planktothrix agardhii]|uniref:hypothetical protein n=1 Tax=Planktothrix agardhii TaxID=1160 RepID=UPI00241E3073